MNKNNENVMNKDVNVMNKDVNVMNKFQIKLSPNKGRYVLQYFETIMLESRIAKVILESTELSESELLAYTNDLTPNEDILMALTDLSNSPLESPVACFGILGRYQFVMNLKDSAPEINHRAWELN